MIRCWCALCALGATAVRRKRNYCCPLARWCRERIQAVSPTTLWKTIYKNVVCLRCSPVWISFRKYPGCCNAQVVTSRRKTVTPEFMDLILTWGKKKEENCNERKMIFALILTCGGMRCAPHTTRRASHKTNLGESVSMAAIVKEIYVGIGWKELWIVLCAREGGRGAEHSWNVITNPLHHVFVLFD